MTKTTSELLTDLKQTLEHQAEAFGPLVYSDQPKKATEAANADAPEPATGDGETTAKPRTPTAAPPEASNLFGEPAGPQSPTDESSPYYRIERLIPGESPLHRFGSLEEVQQFVAETILIELDRTRTNPVFGVGNPNADLLVIGEAPGADEDKQGEPFVGRAGQLLTKILQAIGFERNDVYIANILKSRPPNNRDPLPAEVEAHIPILYKQISLIQPKLILCVGKTAGTSLLNMNASLASMRRIFHDYHGLPVLVTYHPAALLRNPNWKRPTWEDVQLLRTRYDELGGS